MISIRESLHSLQLLLQLVEIVYYIFTYFKIIQCPREIHRMDLTDDAEVPYIIYNAYMTVKDLYWIRFSEKLLVEMVIKGNYFLVLRLGLLQEGRNQGRGLGNIVIPGGDILKYDHTH